MPKKLLLIFAVLMLVLVACGESATEPEAQDTPEDQPASQPEPTQDPSQLPPPVVNVEENEGEGAMAEPTAEPVAEADPDPAPAGAMHPWSPDQFGYGIQSHATIGNPKDTVNIVKNQLGLDWMKVQLEWALVQPTPDSLDWFHYDGIVNDADEQGLNLMFSVVGAPTWTRSSGDHNGPPDDFNQYANFVQQMVQRYQGKVHAVEVWNEQNLDREWTTPAGMVPEVYVDFLSRAYDAIKAVDPNVIVISGALSPTGPGDWIRWADDFEYMELAINAGMLDYTDCVGAHHNGYNIPATVAFDETLAYAEIDPYTYPGPFDNLHHSWSFKTTLEGYAEMIDNAGSDKKLCVTEFGWASSEGYDVAPEGFGFANDNTLQEQADFIVEAYQVMHDSGDVWLAFLFNLDFGNKGNGPTDDPVPFSIVDTNGVPRPAFGAIAGMEKTP